MLPLRDNLSAGSGQDTRPAAGTTRLVISLGFNAMARLVFSNLHLDGTFPASLP